MAPHLALPLLPYPPPVPRKTWHRTQNFLLPRRTCAQEFFVFDLNTKNNFNHFKSEHHLSSSHYLFL